MHPRWKLTSSRMRFRREEEEEEDDGHVADGDDIDRHPEPAETEFRSCKLFSTQPLGEYAGNTRNVGSEQPGAAHCEDDVEGEGRLLKLSVRRLHLARRAY